MNWIKSLIMTIWYVDFCIIKLYMLTSYQDQEAILANDNPSPILHPAPYLPARQPFLENNIQYLNLGILTVICPHCYALHFDCEKLTSSRVNHPKFGMCCLWGQIQLPPLHVGIWMSCEPVQCVWFLIVLCLIVLCRINWDNNEVLWG